MWTVPSVIRLKVEKFTKRINIWIACGSESWDCESEGEKVRVARYGGLLLALVNRNMAIQS
jgi:hypothetical protein